MNSEKPQRISKPILVLGGHGKTGRRIVERLEARGIPVRLGSRTGSPAFDWDDRHTWEAALGGVGAAYISYYPDLAVPGAADEIAALAKLAVQCGVRRLVLLSGRGEPEAQRSEAKLQQSGADWTILRSSWFAQNFSESFLLGPILAGDVALPVAEVAEPFVDADDIAEVAVAALTDSRHSGQVYELTGPRAISFQEAVREIALASERQISYRRITTPDFETDLTAQGVPPETVTLMKELFTVVLDGRNSSTTDGVRRALGREPRDFREYARSAATSGVWNVKASV